MQKNLSVLLLCSATQWPQSAFPWAGTGREFGEGWFRKSISFHGCHFKKNRGAAVAGEEVWTGDRAGSFLLDLQHPWVQRQVLLHRLPSLSTSACEELSLTPFLDGNSVSSADVSMEQNKNTCSLLGRGEGKKLTAESPVFLNRPTGETLCFQLSVRASPRCH